MVNSYSVVFRNSPHSYSVVVRFGIVLFRNSPISYSVVVRSGICRSVPPPLGHNGICQNGKKSPFYTFDSSQNVQKSSQKSFCRCGICRSGRLQAGQNGIYMPLWHMPFRSTASGTERLICRSVPPPYAVVDFCRSGALPLKTPNLT